MSHDNREEVELYKKHKKDCEQHILMNMTKIFDIEDMVYASIWKIVCDCIKNGIPVEKRKEYIYKIVDEQLAKWQ